MNYRKIGSLIKLINEKNVNNEYSKVIGISIDKEFMPSVANINGTDLKKYYIIKKNRFAFNPMHVGRDGKLPIAYYKKDKPALVSPAYTMFEVNDDKINIDYLMLVFKTKEFDHICWYHTDASIRGGLTWEDFCNIEINIPSYDEQKKIVDKYNEINNRINIIKQEYKIYERILEIIFDKVNKKESLLEKNLNEFVDFQEGPGIRNWQFVEKDGIPFVNIRCIQDNDINVNITNQILKEEANGKYSHFLLKENDLIVSTSGTLGKNAIVRKEHLPLCLNTSIIRFTPKIDFSDYAYMVCLIRSKKFIDTLYENATGCAQLNLGPKQLNSLKVRIPDRKIREKFNKYAFPIIMEQQNIITELDELSNLKNEIISLVM